MFCYLDKYHLRNTFLQHVLLIGLFLTCCHPIIAQVYPFQNFSSRNGLPNSNVYDITQDHYGFLWFATESGLSRFDGREFKNYTLHDLGIKSFVSSICRGKPGELLFGCAVDGIYRFEIETGKTMQINTQPTTQSNQLILQNDYVVTLHEYHIIDVISRLSGERISEDHFNGKKMEDYPLCMTRLSNGKILVGQQSGLYVLNNIELTKININGFRNLPVYSIYENEDGSLLLGTDNKIYKITGTHVDAEILVSAGAETRIRNVITDSRQNIWFNPWGSKDIYMITEGNAINISEIIGGINTAITRLFEDNEGILWAGTLGKGVYQFSNKFLFNYPVSADFPNANIKKLLYTGSGILMGTSDGIAHLDSLSGKVTFQKHIESMSQFVRDLKKVTDEEFIAAITDIRLTNPLETVYSFPGKPYKIRYAHSSSLFIDDSLLLAGTWDNILFKYALPGFNIMGSDGPLFPEYNFKLRINCITRDSKNNLWIGSQQGICMVNSRGEKIFPESSVGKQAVYKIIPHPNDEVMVISFEGLTVFRLNVDNKPVMETSHKMVPNTTCMAKTGDNEFLFGTTNGLLFVKDNQEQTITVNDGLLSNSINDILYAEGSSHAWIASAEGLMKIDLDVLRTNLHFRPTIDYMVIYQDGKNIMPTHEPAKFTFRQNSFSIKFTSFNFQNPKLINYQYSVNDEGWLNSPGNELQFASLAPGMHRISIRAGVPNNPWGTASTISILIEPPFYRTWWFYGLSAVVGGFLSVTFYRKQLSVFRRKQEEKSRTKSKLVELQQKALAGNLNPHFVFNSLNSIQHFINSNSPAHANDYLAKFSRLMRMHLNMAEKSFITLQEEINRLEYYLSLEQMRFGDQLSWNISVSPEIDPYRLELPNMIIQPFIENAIWHGIMPSTQMGEIELTVGFGETGTIEIRVRDNGVGMEHHKTPKSKSHDSKGVRLIRERLELLDPSFTRAVVFQNLTPGTLVIITLTTKMYRFVMHESPLPQ